MIKTERYLIFVGEKYEAMGGTSDLLIITDDYQTDFLNNLAKVNRRYIFTVEDHSEIYGGHLLIGNKVKFDWFEIFDLKTKDEILIDLTTIKTQ